MNWRETAACRSEDPELFFPIGDEGLSQRQIEQARSVCHRCPVMRACGSWAVRHGEKYGVWGAMTAGERRSLRLGHGAGSGSWDFRNLSSDA
jgi:WhiB family redox-sensing transcriptional regulator